MSDNGKGDSQRPCDKKKFDENYEKIFGKPEKKQEPKSDDVIKFGVPPEGFDTVLSVTSKPWDGKTVKVIHSGHMEEAMRQYPDLSPDDAYTLYMASQKPFKYDESILDTYKKKYGTTNLSGLLAKLQEYIEKGSQSQFSIKPLDYSSPFQMWKTATSNTDDEYKKAALSIPKSNPCLELTLDGAMTPTLTKDRTNFMKTLGIPENFMTKKG